MRKKIKFQQNNYKYFVTQMKNAHLVFNYVDGASYASVIIIYGNFVDNMILA